MPLAPLVTGEGVEISFYGGARVNFDLFSNFLFGGGWAVTLL